MVVFRILCHFSTIRPKENLALSLLTTHFPERLEKYIRTIFSGLLERSIFRPRDFICAKSIYFEAGLYDEDIPLYEDWDLKLRIAKLAEFYFSSLDMGVGYRLSKSGLSRAAKEEHKYWLRSKHISEETHD